MLSAADTVLVFVDVQGKLADLMHDRDALFENLARLLKGARLLDLPVVWTEQLPDKLGPTQACLAELLEGATPVVKSSFSCCGEPSFLKALQAAGRKQVLLAGIEAHVCVCQTALDLLGQGHEVYVVSDAVSSRTAANRDTALQRLRAAGATVVSTEMTLFELLRDAKDERFREMLRLVK